MAENTIILGRTGEGDQRLLLSVECFVQGSLPGSRQVAVEQTGMGANRDTIARCAGHCLKFLNAEHSWEVPKPEK